MGFFILTGYIIMKIKYAITVFIILFTLTFTSCDTSVEVDPIESQRGTIVTVINESSMDKESIQALIDQFPVDMEIPFEIKFGVKFVSVVYRTIDYNSNIVEASGLIAIPDSEGPFPMASLHHGTQSKRTNVGSQSFIYAPDAIIAGALGYVAVSPDLLGLGVSEMIHPYHHEETSASAPIDLLRTARNYCAEMNIELKNEIYLAGYSQGGYVTAAVQKEIEANLSDEFNVVAAAPMAGAHDLVGTANYILANETYERPSFLAFFIVAYNEIYGWDNLNYYFTTEYEQAILDLFDGSLTTEEIDEILPKELDKLFNETFITQFRTAADQQLYLALEDNSLLDFAPAAPVLIVHGDADTYVPYQNAIIAKEKWEFNGAASVDLVTIEGGNHVSSIFPAILETIKWFETIRQQFEQQVASLK